MIQTNNKPPVYVNSNVEEFFKDVVMPPIFNQELFHPVTNPLRYCLALFGRKGVKKRALMQQLMDTHGVMYASVGVTPENIEDIPQAIVEYVADIGGTLEPDDPRLRGVVLIEHADRLCFEPPTKEVMEFALDISKVATIGKVMIIGLFDRLPPSKDDPNINNGLRHYQTKFFTQFKGGGYMPPPHSDYRQQLFRWYFDFYQNNAGKAAKITFDLSDGDYVELADASSNTTIDMMVEWIQKVLYVYAKPRDEPLVINIDTLSEHLNNAQGFPHICRMDLEALENKWRIKNGKGLLDSDRKPKSGVDFSHIKGLPGAKESKKKKEEKVRDTTGFKSKITSFTTDAVDFEDAEKIIKHQKKEWKEAHQHQATNGGSGGRKKKKRKKNK